LTEIHSCRNPPILKVKFVIRLYAVILQQNRGGVGFAGLFAFQVGKENALPGKERGGGVFVKRLALRGEETA
jgi:hypothetical protein